MPIDFHDPVNSRTYSGREADRSWRAAVVRLVDPIGARVVHVGGGGGTYPRAWSEMGAATVTGVDFSAPILEAARSASGVLPGVTFRQGDAAATGLEGGRADIVFARALVHHVADVAAVAAEAARLLRPGGAHLIEERPPQGALPDPGPDPRGRRAARVCDTSPRLAVRRVPAAAGCRERPPSRHAGGGRCAGRRGLRNPHRDVAVGGPASLRRPGGVPTGDRHADRAVDPARAQRSRTRPSGGRTAEAASRRLRRRAGPLDPVAGGAACRTSVSSRRLYDTSGDDTSGASVLIAGLLRATFNATVNATG